MKYCHNTNKQCLMTSRRRIAAHGLPSIVDPPLQTRQRTNHQNTRSQTVPASLPAQNLHRLQHRDLLRGVVHLRHARVERMRHQRAEHTRNVARSERHRQLRRLAVRLARLRQQEAVEQTHDVLERGELHHRVRDLTAPQRHQTLPQSTHALSTRDLADSGHQLVGEVHLGRTRLDTHLGRLHRALEDIREDLSGRRSGQVDRVLVVLGSLLSHQVDVEVLEQLVTSELEETLHGITVEGRLPSAVQTVTIPTLLRNLLQTVHKVLVQSGVRLATALDQIERANSGVSGSARENASHKAGAVETSIVLRLSVSGLEQLKRTGVEHR